MIAHDCEVIQEDKSLRADFEWAQFGHAALVDTVIDGLPHRARLALERAAEGWLGSLGFCTQYAVPPATRVYVRLDEEANVTAACFYTRQSGRWWFKTLHLFGPCRFTEDELQQIMREKCAALAIITCMGSEDLERWPTSWYRCSRRAVNEDIIVDLPGTEDEYLASLGHNARTQLPYYLRRVEKEWGSGFTVLTVTGSDISRQMFADLVDLNRIRIEHKGVTHLWNEGLIERRWKLARECGLFVGLYRHDHLVAGTISYLHRDQAYFILIGHHEEYNRLRLGKLALWLTIRHLIRSGVVRYHLLWGASPYKLSLGGRPHVLSELTVFRHSLVAAVWYLDQWICTFVVCAKRLVKASRAMTRRMMGTLRGSPETLRTS
ncbi:hypothetical protein W02_16040 [Nitrospira sp. KM1]|uniref:GNAT family N-acetyltransferase n=1 Tax=Nitrospira sp. KM1 TaxID=1936990 RepID=UPI0013A79B1D|nr:GNAT family N-acetyltransferase [Nitrospira sp. KM1]BCA54464.1 hypothetical protein W02_16040 [Nitrospira sp. KM1]